MTAAMLEISLCFCSSYKSDDTYIFSIKPLQSKDATRSHCPCRTGRHRYSIDFLGANRNINTKARTPHEAAPALLG